MGYFTARTVKCDRQMANTYILYMMAGCLFAKARLTNSLMEANLGNQYKEMANAKQEQQEAFTENKLKQVAGEYMTAFRQMKSEIYVKKQESFYCFWFRTGFEEMIAVVDKNGRISIEKAYRLTETKWIKLCSVVVSNLENTQKENRINDQESSLKKTLKRNHGKMKNAS